VDGPTPSRLRTLRLAAQGLAAPGAGPAAAVTPEDVVGRMTALQGQDLGQVLWAIGVRVPGSTRADVRAAFDDGRIVRSWPMRGTLHVTRPDDLRLLLSLTAARTIRTIARRGVERGVDDEVLAVARRAVVGALEGGAALERDELHRALTAAGVDPGGGRGAHVLLRLAQDGLLVWGPTDRTADPDRSGRADADGPVRQAAVLLDEWAPAAGPVPEPDDALGRVLLGHLRGRGPATEADTAAWTKLPLAEVRRARAVVGDAVEDLGGGLFDLADRPAPGTAPTAHLLPGFDEHVLGYADRSAQLDPTVADRIVPGGNGVFLPTLVVRGRTVGTWTRQGTGRTARLVVTPFAPLDPAAVRALVAVGERHGRWLGRPTEVVVA
jgi:hypothetical protein